MILRSLPSVQPISVTNRSASCGENSSIQSSEASQTDEVSLSCCEGQKNCSKPNAEAVAFEVAGSAVGGSVGVPFRLLVMGPPGSGKSTQGRTIAAEHNVPHVSLGSVLRSEVEAGTELGKLVEPYTSTGRLVPDNIVIEVVRDRMEQPDVANGFVLDGFPRTGPQVPLYDSLGIEDTQALLIDVDEDEVRRRLLSRGRADDTEEVINDRLRIYREQTVPVLEQFESRGVLLTADGNGSIEETAANIRAALD